MQAIETYEWVFDAPQTDELLLDDAGAALVSGTQRMAITYVKCTLANSSTVDVQVRIGFATTTLPTITVNSKNGQRGVFTSHAAMAKGGGEVNANGGATLALGDVGVGPRITITGVTSSGQMRVIMNFVLLEEA